MCTRPNMICIIVASDLNFEVDHKTIVEKFGSSRIPTSILSGVRHETVLQSWWKLCKQDKIFSDVYLVTNALLYKFYEQWALCNELPLSNIINNGMSMQHAKPGVGVVADLDLVIRTKRINEDVLVVSGEVLLHPDQCDMRQIVQQFGSRQHYNIAVCYKAIDGEGTADDNHYQYRRLALHPTRLLNFRDAANGCVVISTLHTNCDEQNITRHNNQPTDVYTETVTDLESQPPVMSCKHNECKESLLASKPSEGVSSDSWLGDFISSTPTDDNTNESSADLTDQSTSDTSIQMSVHRELDMSVGRNVIQTHSETDSELSDDLTTHMWDMQVLVYCLRAGVFNKLQQFIVEQNEQSHHTFSYFLEWLVNLKKENIYGLYLPHGCHYLQLHKTVGSQAVYNETEALTMRLCPQQVIRKRAYARVGLVGNPSDGFHGKTISLSISNFWAEVTLIPSEQLVLSSDVLNTSLVFRNLKDLHHISEKDGYGGGLPLLQATCKKFYSFCQENRIKLVKQNFTITYKTNIPRQVGLAGSSAIIKATLDCLIDFYNLTMKDFPRVDQPQWILEVEKDELNIRAGLQDRVIQVYEGMVYMDFAQELFEKQGHGNYVNLQPDKMPNFWLSYISEASDSGKIHNNVASRWRQGDQTVVMGMQLLADLTDLARQAIKDADWKQLSSIMDQNFDLRRKIYGDQILGRDNLMMIEIARSYGSSAKFSGSGGAVVGLCLNSDKMVEMKKSLLNAGFMVCDVIPNLPS